MKKILSLLCIIGCMLSFSACGKSKSAEGINARNIARFTPVLTDGENSYIKYSGTNKDEYVRLDEETFTLIRTDMGDTKLSVEKTGREAAISIKAIEGRDSEIKTSNEYKKILKKLQKKLKKFENYECIVIKIGDELYGAVNCYTAAGGESGDELLNENFKESYLVSFKKNKVKLSKKIDDMAILAVNSTHYIGYGDLTFYSVDRESGERTELFKDRWHSASAPNQNSAYSVFTDELFLISGVALEEDNAFESTIICKIDGSNVKMLLNNRKVG